MKTFKEQCAQGDVLIRRIDDQLPPDARAVGGGEERHIIAHSETGHHHTITAPPPIVQMFGSANPLIRYMRVTRPVELRHERSFDTHEPIEINPGTYEIRRQREWSPEGWRMVQD